MTTTRKAPAATDAAAAAPAAAPISRRAVENVDDRVTEDVPCPEWGGVVRLRSLTGKERDAFEESCVTGRGRNAKVSLLNMRARLVAMTAVDGDGQALFTLDDVPWLGRKSALVLDRLFTVARRLSGLTDEDVEELAANFDDDPSGRSTSG